MGVYQPENDSEEFQFDLIGHNSRRDNVYDKAVLSKALTHSILSFPIEIIEQILLEIIMAEEIVGDFKSGKKMMRKLLFVSEANPRLFDMYNAALRKFNSFAAGPDDGENL